MAINARPYERTNQMIHSIDMLLQIIEIALASALVAGYRLACCATRQSVGDGLRDE